METYLNADENVVGPILYVYKEVMEEVDRHLGIPSHLMVADPTSHSSIRATQDHLDEFYRRKFGFVESLCNEKAKGAVVETAVASE